MKSTSARSPLLLSKGFLWRAVAAVLLTVAPLFTLPAHSSEQAAPESVGMSSEALKSMAGFVNRHIAAGHISGGVTLVARHGKLIHLEAHGQRGLDDARPMTTDALFRIFSMTKPITTVAAMMLYEEGYFHLNDPVAKYLPELANLEVYQQDELVPVGRAITIEQLMTHTAGLTYGWANDHPVELAYQESALQYSENLDDFLAKLGVLPLRFTPGERYHYSIATDVLGALVERLSGETLETFLSTRLFQPLGMDDTFFNVPDDKLDRVVPNHGWNPETNALGPLPATYQMPIQGVTLFSGGGGLVSSARDYLIFCEMLRQGGSYKGVRILGPKTIEFMTMDHLTPEVRNKGATEYPAQHLYPGQSFGLGFGVITDPGQTGVISSLGAYSWGGAANTKFWIDPEEDLIAIFMTQVMNAPFGDQLRFDMKVATYQAITELGSQR